MRVFGMAGTLRDESFNRRLLDAARAVAPQGMEIVPHDIEDVPLYDADLEKEGDPEPVQRLKRAIGQADALLISTPEYQHGVPGVLRNALDWASRPPGAAPLTGKPVAIMGATPGFIGTARAQKQLRQLLAYNDCPMVMEPEVLVGHVDEKVDHDGHITDEETLDFVRELLGNLAGLVAIHEEA